MVCSTEKWGVFEISIHGPKDGNPFVDYEFTGVFTGEYEKVEVDGFYDGDGVYRIRFMPAFEGTYKYVTKGNFDEAHTEGTFFVTPAGEQNHGRVHVKDRFHFAYDDGTRYYPIGTTCYVWTLQPENIQKQTMETLAEGYFNKIRFCIFPKHYIHNFKDPILFPYKGTPVDCAGITLENFSTYSDCAGNHWDFKQFNPAYFRLIEQKIIALGELGIEADVILFHPYDRWGFSRMGREDNVRYLNYVIARLSAYRNVWWSMANEYDLIKNISIDDWEYYAKVVCEKDPYNHLRSIHNCEPFYDYSKPWITHCCMQRQDRFRTVEYTDEYREKYGKPIVWDEVAYEGNIDMGWGNISACELVRRFWEATVRGGYVGHGETYEHPDDVLWWSHGGVLHGESPKRIQFLRSILCDVPGLGLKRGEGSYDETVAVPEDDAQCGYQIYYFGIARPSFRIFSKEPDVNYQVDVIDTWEMTITDAGIHSGRFRIDLPGKEYMAIRLKRV